MARGPFLLLLLLPVWRAWKKLRSYLCIIANANAEVEAD